MLFALTVTIEQYLWEGRFKISWDSSAAMLFVNGNLAPNGLPKAAR